MLLRAAGIVPPSIAAPGLSPEIESTLFKASELHRAGRSSEAETVCRRTLAIQPTAPGYAILGSTLFAQGHADDAIEAFRQALTIEADNMMALNNLARVLRHQGRLTDAAECFRLAVKADPKEVATRNNLASTLQQLGRTKQAIREARESVRLYPAVAESHQVLASALLADKKLTEARDETNEVLRLDPDSADAWATIAMIEHALGDAASAITAYREAIARVAKADFHSALLISMQYVAQVTEQEIFDEHRNWNELYVKPVTRDTSWPGMDFDPARPLRVGFVSADFRQSSTPYLALGMLDHRPREDWSLVCYSNRLRRDTMTDAFRKRADDWRVIAGVSDEAVAAQIRDDRIDILFDLNGHTHGNRLLVFARQPAPVQVSWLDYVATTGLDTMDYFFGDAVHTPATDQRYFVERIKHLPLSYIRYQLPDDAPDVGPLPADRNGHVTFGCCNSAFKISRPVVDAWAEILSRVPGSRLLLSAKEFGARETRHRFERLFAERSIDPKRLEFSSGSKSHRKFLATYNRIDIALDTFPYSGGVTTLEALFMGVPVVSFAGTRMCARHATAHLAIAGLADWAAADVRGYVVLAAEKARDLDRLAACRQGLRQQLSASPLTGGSGLASGFTRLLREVWREACRNNQD